MNGNFVKKKTCGRRPNADSSIHVQDILSLHALQDRRLVRSVIVKCSLLTRVLNIGVGVVFYRPVDSSLATVARASDKALAEDWEGTPVLTTTISRKLTVQRRRVGRAPPPTFPYAVTRRPNGPWPETCRDASRTRDADVRLFQCGGNDGSACPPKTDLFQHPFKNLEHGDDGMLMPTPRSIALRRTRKRDPYEHKLLCRAFHVSCNVVESNDVWSPC